MKRAIIIGSCALILGLAEISPSDASSRSSLEDDGAPLKGIISENRGFYLGGVNSPSVPAMEGSNLDAPLAIVTALSILALIGVGPIAYWTQFGMSRKQATASTGSSKPLYILDKPISSAPMFRPSEGDKKKAA